jgi:isopropylmalate/homocitrate/citramalate synthase
MVNLDNIKVDNIKASLEYLKRTKGFKEDSWLVSPFNYGPALDLALPPTLTICDITLREGEQTPGVKALTKELKMEVARALDKAGVPEIQVGIGISRRRIQDEIKAVAALGLKSQIVTYAGSLKEVDIAAECGVDIIEFITLPTPEMHQVLGEDLLSTADQIRRGSRILAHAKAKGLKVKADINWVGLADLKFIREYFKVMAQEGADSVQLADSSGILNIAAIKWLVQEVRRVVGKMSVGLHLHNDFGLATGLALAGLEAGVNEIDVTLNGLGERAGNPALAEVVVGAEVLYGVSTGVKLSELTPLAQLCASLTEFPIPTNKPLVGSRFFSNTVEIEWAVEPVDPFLSNAIRPAAVGNDRPLFISKHSGRNALRYKLAALGYVASEPQLDAMLDTLGALLDTKRFIEDDDILGECKREGVKKI